MTALLPCRVCGSTTSTCRNSKKRCLCGARYNQPCQPQQHDIHDRPPSSEQPHRAGRDPIPRGKIWPYHALLQMRKDGITEPRIAMWFGVSTRRIQKVLHDARQAAREGPL